MRYIISTLLIAVLSLGLVINEASAKRFGGGRSFGVQRSHSSLFSSNKAQSTSSMGQKLKQNRWGGMLGGLLIGGILGSLLMGHGLASGLFSWILLAVALYFIFNFIRRRTQPAMQSAPQSNFNQNGFNAFKQQFTGTNSSSGQASDFVDEDFLRTAKVCFIRLQAAYDQKDLRDLQTFTTPEVFAEIKMQLDERADAPNKTEVINLNAELLDVSKQTYSTIASVRFTGSIKENDEPISQLNEIWHFRQLERSKEWIVDGLQQEVYQP